MLKIGKRDAAGLSTGHANKSQDSDKDLYGAIRDEIDLRNTATIATADSAVTTVADSAVTTVADATDLAEVILLANDLKVEFNAAVVLINDLKVEFNAAVVLINELKAELNTASASTKLFEK